MIFSKKKSHTRCVKSWVENFDSKKETYKSYLQRIEQEKKDKYKQIIHDLDEMNKTKHKIRDLMRNYKYLLQDRIPNIRFNSDIETLKYIFNQDPHLWDKIIHKVIDNSAW